MPCYLPAAARDHVAAYGELAAKTKDLRGSIASRDLRAQQPDGLRKDSVSYSFQALQLFEGVNQQSFMAGLSKPAAMGQGVLQTNKPGTSLSLKYLPGSWSDPALASAKTMHDLHRLGIGA